MKWWALWPFFADHVLTIKLLWIQIFNCSFTALLVFDSKFFSHASCSKPNSTVVSLWLWLSNLVIVLTNWYQDFGSSHSIHNHIYFVSKQIRILVLGGLILLITCMITYRIRLHSAFVSLITCTIINSSQENLIPNFFTEVNFTQGGKCTWDTRGNKLECVAHSSFRPVYIEGSKKQHWGGFYYAIGLFVILGRAVPW